MLRNADLDKDSSNSPTKKKSGSGGLDIDKLTKKL